MPISAQNQSKRSPQKPENPWLNLICNLVLPAVILMTLSGENRLGPVYGLIAGLAFPLGYGIYDLIRRRHWNFLSTMGVISVAATGGLGLLKADGIWFAVEKTVLPTVLGIAVLASLKSRTPLVRTFLYNDQVIDVDLVHRELENRDNVDAFERLLVRATYLLTSAFFLSAILHFVLARMILTSPAGTPEFNRELGRMTALSWPAITLPVMVMFIFALWRLLAGIKRLTGLDLDAIFKSPPEKPKKQS